MSIFRYLSMNIFNIDIIFIKQYPNTVGTGLNDANVSISYGKLNRLNTVLNTIIDFCGNICINCLNEIFNTNIVHILFTWNILYIYLVWVSFTFDLQTNLILVSSMSPKFESFGFIGNMFPVSLFFSKCIIAAFN